MSILAWPRAAGARKFVMSIRAVIAAAIIAAAMISLVHVTPSLANSEIAKNTGEPCSNCHMAPVSNGVLNQRGEEFRAKFFGSGTAAPQVVAPSCPPGFVFSNGQCVGGAAPAPQAGDWYAIAGSFPSQGQAQSRANQLGAGWIAKHTSQCPNMTPGLWITTAGGFAQSTAQLYVNQASQFGAYAKRCNR